MRVSVCVCEREREHLMFSRRCAIKGGRVRVCEREREGEREKLIKRKRVREGERERIHFQCVCMGERAPDVQKVQYDTGRPCVCVCEREIERERENERGRERERQRERYSERVCVYVRECV